MIQANIILPPGMTILDVPGMRESYEVMDYLGIPLTKKQKDLYAEALGLKAVDPRDQ